MNVQQQSKTADMLYNLGISYYTLPSGDRQANLEKAITNFQAALQAFPRATAPDGWARTQHALGNAYRDLPGGDRRENLNRAIACYKAALEVYTAKSTPSYYSSTQADLEEAQAWLNALKKGQTVPSGPAPTRVPGALAAPPRPSQPNQRLWIVLSSILIAVLVILAGVITLIYFTRHSGSGSARCVDGTITVASTTALVPVLQAVASDYQAKCKDSNISFGALPSKMGLSRLEAGTIQVAVSDVFADPSQSDLVDYQVSAIIFTLVINDKVTGVANLTTQQIKGIYNGSTVNWKDVGGNDLPITLISRPPSSGTVATFERNVLCGTETVQGPANLQSDSTDQLGRTVQSTDGALAYITLAGAMKYGLTTLSIDGHAPGIAGVKSNAYQFWSIGHLYTKGQATGLAKAFIDYLSTDSAKQVATSNDPNFLSINDLTPALRASRQPGLGSC